MCVCVCVCVCMREGECMNVCVCVCVCVKDGVEVENRLIIIVRMRIFEEREIIYVQCEQYCTRD